MSSVYRFSKIGTRVLYKVRHHRGHGVHSPFVFNLIKNVIEEKCPYYCYNDLAEYLTNNSDKKPLVLDKKNRLSFRLTNYFQTKNILEIGAGSGVNTLSLAAPSSDIQCIAVETDEAKANKAKKIYSNYTRSIILHNSLDNIPQASYDCISINLNNFSNFDPEDLDRLIGMCHEKSFILVRGIRRNKKQNAIWKRLSRNKERTAKLDLFDIGILFFDKQLSRWQYQISF